MVADILGTCLLAVALVFFLWAIFAIFRDEWRREEWRRQQRCTHFINNVCVDPPVTWKDLFRWRS